MSIGFKSLALLFVLVVSLGTREVHAGEGAASNYFPGAYGDFLVGVAPEPGPVAAVLNLFYSAEGRCQSKIS